MIIRSIVETLMKNTENNHDAAEFESTLHWLAFCYVAGELSAEQSIQFEQRIADDLEAQVAVADAVSLSSLTCGAIETLSDRKASLATRQRHHSQPVTTQHSFWWRWVAVTAAGFFVIVSVWQLLPNVARFDDVAVRSVDSSHPLEASTIGNDELDMWDQTVEMYRWENLDEDRSEGWAPGVAGDSLEQAYTDIDSDSEEIAEALLVDSDLASIFASAMSGSSLSKGEM